VRVVTVSDRKAAETILSRLAKDAPLALGARGIARVRTLLEKQVRALPPEVRIDLADLPLGGHTQIVPDGEAYSIYQRSTFDFYRQAWALHKAGKNVKALRKVERDLILNPDHAKGLALIGRIYEQRREYRRASEAYQQLIGFHPNSSLGYRMIGRIFELEKRWDQAIKSYEFGLELNPRQHDVLNNLALLYAARRGDPKKGLSLIEKALALRPKTAGYLDTLAQIRKRLGLKGDLRTAKLKEASKKLKESSNGRAKAGAAKGLKSASSAAGRPARNRKRGAASPKVGPLPPPPRVSPDGWPPPKAPPGFPASPPLLVGPKRRKPKPRAAPREKGFFGRELFVMNPALKKEGWGERPSGAEASRFAKAGNGSSAKAASAPERIQILDGSGDMSAARRVKTLLTSKGFRIARIGKSDKGLWRRTVLYYKKDSERRAEQVAGAIPGRRLLLRPLKWRSVYDIILVVGKDRASP
jgi:tetratricopeptide (TPR) repeat protein